MNKTRRRALALLLALVLLGSLGYIGWHAADRSRGVRENRAAGDLAAIPPLPELPPEELEPDEPIPEELLTVLDQADLEALQAVNGQVVGWIAIPGTEISYPVLQGEDNQYYLKHTWNHVKSAAGSVSLECRCASDLTDFNTIFYGHRMRNGTMFGRLRDYNKEEFWRQHPVVCVVTNENVYACDIYAAFEAEVEGLVYRLDLKTAEDRAEMLQYALARSAIDTGIVPAAEDRVVTLSTCTGRGYASRWVVQAVIRNVWPRETGSGDAPS